MLQRIVRLFPLYLLGTVAVYLTRLAFTLGACLIAPASSYADRKIKIRRDLDGDGHYNTKTLKVSGRHSHSRQHYGHSGHHYGYNRRSYSRPYSYYNYGYSRPYYSYGPSFGLSFYSRPSYYYSEPSYYSDSYVYRSAPRTVSSYEGSLAADVQQALKRRGYYKGGIDGDIGPASRSAIRAYQSDRGLAVTGRIDRSLLEALGIG
ncbi:MAG: hypothetical protein EOP84_04400 [Verrucomicrobiaceae bacterium]|nr:MAG: hypothetical protein EOP84_04400 [Verrucomicrobiaceae bacterium]